MPPLPIIANTYRVTMPWTTTTNRVRPVNVIHVRSASGTASTVAALLAAQLSAHGALMFGAIYSGYSLEEIEVLPLDGATTTFLQAVSSPPSGGGTGGILPGLAQVVSFHTLQRGSRGRGRCYIGPVGETQVNDGNMNSSTNNDALTGWGAFVTAISGGSPATDLVVASYKHADAHDVQSIRVDTVCGIQRRRQDQLR